LDDLLRATSTCKKCKLYSDEYDQVLHRIDEILLAIKPDLERCFEENGEDYEDLMEEWYTYEVGADELHKREYYATMNEAADHMWELENSGREQYENMMVLEYKHFREFLKEHQCFGGVHELFLMDLKNQVKDGKFPSCNNNIGHYRTDY